MLKMELEKQGWSLRSIQLEAVCNLQGCKALLDHEPADLAQLVHHVSHNTETWSRAVDFHLLHAIPGVAFGLGRIAWRGANSHENARKESLCGSGHEPFDIW